ncbi:MAG: hypothetical protein P4M14_02110 [Gammaproteobacteria bacterium]|nr:hypothetical protein [Gammaproteobacteria bacterium]
MNGVNYIPVRLLTSGIIRGLYKNFLKFIVTNVLIAFFILMTTQTSCEAASLEQSLSFKFAQYFSDKDLKGMASLLDKNIVVYDPGKVTKGKNNFLNLLKNNFDKTNTIVFRILHIYQLDHKTIFEFKLSFDNDRYDGVDIVVWEKNKMKEIRCYYYPSPKSSV